MLAPLLAIAIIGAPPVDATPQDLKGVAILQQAGCDSGFEVICKEPGADWQPEVSQAQLGTKDWSRLLALFYVALSDKDYSVRLEKAAATGSSSVHGSQSANFDAWVNGPKDETAGSLNGFGLRDLY